MKIANLVEEEIQPYTKTSIADTTELKNLLVNNCSDVLANYTYNRVLYRGSRTNKLPFQVLDSSTGIRRSANTSNHYTLLFDNSPYLAEFPKRSRSFVCSTFLGEASGYGEVNVMFPFNGVEIGVCPSNDFWGINVTVPGLALNHESIRMINMALGMCKVPHSSFDDMQSEIESIDFAERYREFAAKILNTDLNIPWYMDRQSFRPLTNPSMMIEHLFQCMRPNVLNIRKYNTMTFPVPDQRECWFSGPCVAINHNTYMELITEGFFDDIVRSGQ